jgi:hypothetical protein
MAKYRKKPIVIEAFQITRLRRLDNSEWPEWLNSAWNKQRTDVGAVFSDQDYGRLQVHTLEGILFVDWNDWMIRGVKGELYPCKPDVFEITYEALDA